jgi:predicted house-cleaning noncanonical NTP pyrophosphatase (MazG superfamily)
MATILGKMKEYHKLVRDRIPEIIEKAGKIATCRPLNDVEFREALRAKVVEEALELLEADDAGIRTELADLAEVLQAVLNAYGVSDATLAAIRAERNAERGAFEKRIFLESVSG